VKCDAPLRDLLALETLTADELTFLLIEQAFSGNPKAFPEEIATLRAKPWHCFL